MCWGCTCRDGRPWLAGLRVHLLERGEGDVGDGRRDVLYLVRVRVLRVRVLRAVRVRAFELRVQDLCVRSGNRPEDARGLSFSLCARHNPTPSRPPVTRSDAVPRTNRFTRFHPRPQSLDCPLSEILSRCDSASRPRRVCVWRGLAGADISGDAQRTCHALSISTALLRQHRRWTGSGGSGLLRCALWSSGLWPSGTTMAGASAENTESEGKRARARVRLE